MEQTHWIDQPRAVIATLLICALALLLLTRTLPIIAANVGTTSSSACQVVNSPKDLRTGQATNLAIVKQGYECILNHYITGKTLNDSTLLQGAFHEIMQALPTSLGITLPSLTGNRTTDWQTFATAYNAVAAHLQRTTAAQRAMAELALFGMTLSLHDDHTAYLPPNNIKLELAQLTPGTPAPTLGIILSPLTMTTSLFITTVLTNTPASAAGLQPGDTIQTVGGQPAVKQGQGTAALQSLLSPQVGTPIVLTVERPSTGAHIAVSLQPKSMVVPATTAKLLTDDIGYVKLLTFTSNAAAQVFGALKKLSAQQPLQGIVLDLRDDPGGDEDQAVQIISAFVHNAIVGYGVSNNGHRQAIHTDNKIALLHEPLVILVDGGSASSSELVAAAVRDLHAGTVVGSRTAGALAAAYFYSLSDGSGLEITEERVLGAAGEKVDGVGVAPQQQVVATAASLSAGNDPAIDQAVQDILQAARKG